MAPPSTVARRRHASSPAPPSSSPRRSSARTIHGAALTVFRATSPGPFTTTIGDQGTGPLEVAGDDRAVFAVTATQRPARWVELALAQAVCASRDTASACHRTLRVDGILASNPSLSTPATPSTPSPKLRSPLPSVTCPRPSTQLAASTRAACSPSAAQDF